MKNTNITKFALSLITIATLTMTGCTTVKGLVDKNKEVIATAEKSEADYYQDAQNALAKERYREAIIALNNVRTFYPTGATAEQALLDLIYAEYQANDFEAVLNSTKEFIRLYPNSPNIDYALYVQGVTNMGGSPKLSRLFNLDQSQRDVTYLRLAFNDFQTLISHFPNSVYAPDTAQRMIAIYNDFAEHELVAARWYLKREAYVAAANRAKWVFQYHPQSEAVPEAIAILAHSNEKLGLIDTANQYKTLLQINYPSYLNQDGSVKLNLGATSFTKQALSSLSLGKLGRIKDKNTLTQQSSYEGQTAPQLIQEAMGLTLPNTDSQ